ncbi:MAG: hypothetical protein J6R52_02035 [Alphaproteobacteria bacterium]|nr:hypothetical protein [Alphaproteobacteria bacterium]
MKSLFSVFLSIFITIPVMAETVQLASPQYVKNNCVTKSGTWEEQTLTGNYSIDGSLSVPTPPLPPEQ